MTYQSFLLFYKSPRKVVVDNRLPEASIHVIDVGTDKLGGVSR